MELNISGVAFEYLCRIYWISMFACNYLVTILLLKVNIYEIDIFFSYISQNKHIIVQQLSINLREFTQLVQLMNWRHNLCKKGCTVWQTISSHALAKHCVDLNKNNLCHRKSLMYSQLDFWPHCGVHVWWGVEVFLSQTPKASSVLSTQQPSVFPLKDSIWKLIPFSLILCTKS
jgi:hypothetical protein